MSNEAGMEKGQSATETVLDETQKKLSRVGEAIGRLEDRLSVVLLPLPDNKEQPPVPGKETEGMSPLKQRLTDHIYNIDRLIANVDRIISRLEV